MNKTIKSLVVAALVISAQNVFATDTNKTFMAQRNQGFTLPLEQTGWGITNDKMQDRFGAHLMANVFYGQSTKNAETGKYFGAVSKNSFTVNGTTGDLNDLYIIHNQSSGSPSSQNLGTVKIEPKSIHYGVDLAYFQDLSKVVNGLYLKVNLPVMYLENDMKLTAETTMASYLKGDYTGTNENLQAKLTNALIDGKKHSKTGVDNVDVMVGYKFLNKESYHASLNLGVVIPTGEASKGVYAFEPLVGHNHFGFGGGLEAQARVWGESDHHVDLNFAANYRYFFKATEKRTLGLKGQTPTAWTQYVLLTKTGDRASLYPAANYTTLDVDVTPKHNLDGIVALAYNKGGFCFDLGYNLFYKDTESVKTKGTLTAATYKLADTGFRVGSSPAVTGDLTTSNLDTDAASTPSQFTNGVYGALNYAFKDWQYPVSLGLGGKYEFASKNSALEGWQGWVKAGLSF